VLLRANVIVNTSLSLNQFQMQASEGSIEFTSPLASPPGCNGANLCATAYVEAEDSLGGYDQLFNVADNGATSASASTALAQANSAASAPAQTASASDGVNIPLISASASSSAQGTLWGTFEIVGTSDNATVQFSAALTADQILATDNNGVFASSEVIFTLALSSGDTPLFLDNPLTIGSGSSIVSPYSGTLTGSSSPLLPDTAYTLVIQTDAESSGLNSGVPEPSSLILSITALGVYGLITGRKGWRRRRCAARKTI
jgi:hypothetical protein